MSGKSLRVTSLTIVSFRIRVKFGVRTRVNSLTIVSDRLRGGSGFTFSPKSLIHYSPSPGWSWSRTPTLLTTIKSRKVEKISYLQCLQMLRIKFSNFLVSGGGSGEKKIFSVASKCRKSINMLGKSLRVTSFAIVFHSVNSLNIVSNRLRGGSVRKKFFDRVVMSKMYKYAGKIVEVYFIRYCLS